jgi:hypothetical protein
MFERVAPGGASPPAAQPRRSTSNVPGGARTPGSPSRGLCAMGWPRVGDPATGPASPNAPNIASPIGVADVPHTTELRWQERMKSVRTVGLPPSRGARVEC